MIALLITTGKNPGKTLRAIALALNLALPGSIFEGRGRRTLSSLVSKARKRHFSRICAIYSHQGAPSGISFISLNEDGGFSWMSPKISITGAMPVAKVPKGQSSSVSITGAKSKILRQLFGMLPPGDDEVPASKVIAGASKITILLGKEKILQLGVKYEK